MSVIPHMKPILGGQAHSTNGIGYVFEMAKVEFPWLK